MHTIPYIYIYMIHNIHIYMNFTVVVDHGNKLRKIIFQSRTTFKVENFGLALLRIGIGIDLFFPRIDC